MASIQLTVGNAKGRTFTCLRDHGVLGSSEVGYAGDKGVVSQYFQHSNQALVLLWRNNTYKSITLKVQYLRIGPPPARPDIVGYPFRCADPYTNRSGMTVQFLDEGSIVEYDNTTTKAKVSIPERNARMWVDPRYLHIGEERKYGDIIVETGLSPHLTSDPSTAELNATDFPFTHLAFPLIISIMNQQGSMGFLPNNLRTILPTRHTALDLARRIARGVDRARLSNAFVIGNPWTWEEIVARGVTINDNTRGNGAYARFYSNFKPGTKLQGHKARTYVGKTTIGFGSRFKGHEKSTKNPDDDNYNTGHYRIARQAGIRAAVVLAYLDNFPESEIAVAEQLFILILRAYRPEVLNWVRKGSAGASVSSSSGDLASVQNEIIETLEDKEPATLLTQLAEDLFSKSGWGHRLETSGGCNKQSPLGDSGSYEKTLWTMVEYPDRIVYYRSPYEWFEGAGGYVLFKKNCHDRNGKKSVYEVKRTKEHPRPPKGKSIHFSVEIMKQGRHEYAFSRLPDYGIWDNWDSINQIALRMRWKDKDDGQFCHSFYLQMEKDELAVQKPDQPGSIGVHMDLTNLRMFLERTACQNPLPWFDTWDTARVKQLKFDHLAQAVRIIDPPAPNPAILPTPVRDEQQLRANYAAVGLTNYGRIITDPAIQKLLSKRTKQWERVCDACYLFNSRHKYYAWKKGNADKKCVLTNGDTTCTFCFSWGHRCTFTRPDVLEANWTAVLWYANWPWETTTIPDPGFESHTLAK